MAQIPVIFDPSNEPYLGRQSVQILDGIIPVALESWARIERHLAAKEPSLLQTACIDLFPSTLSIGLSIRELVRQGYIYGAVVLLRPIMERAITIRYLVAEPSALSLWSSGWDYGKRPKMQAMLNKLDKDSLLGGANPLRYLNEHIHADPKGSIKLFRGAGSEVKFVVSKDLSNPHECDEICMCVAAAFSMVMATSLTAFFPENSDKC